MTSRGVRGICVGLGFMSAYIGAGIGIWSAIRMWNLRILVAAIPALLGSIIWTWFFVMT